MKDHIYKLVELIGTSTTTLEDAINSAIHRAAKTLKNLRWFEVIQIRGEVDQDKVAHWQVTLKIGFTVEEEHKE